jgi:hypothetical protein
MPSPFPGMDPYLENPVRWPGFHSLLIGEVQSQLNAALTPNYVAMIEERVYISTPVDPGRKAIIPDIHIVGDAVASGIRVGEQTLAAVVEPIEVELLDDEVHDHYVTIATSGEMHVVTVIEILSPSNKVHGSIGQELFLDKRREVISSSTNWVEIDLLREGDRFAPHELTNLGDYFVHVVPAGKRKSRVWPIKLPQPLPKVNIPLSPGDEPVALDLQATLAEVYRRAAYHRVLRYDRPAVPPIPPQYAEWATDLLKTRGQAK